MANTFSLIEAKTLSTATSSVAFTSIPQTYTDLKLMVSARSGLSANYNYISLQLNQDTSSTVQFYAGYSVGGNNSADNTTNTGLTGYTWIPASNVNANLFSNLDAYIPNYTSTVNKVLSFDWTSEANSASINILGYTNCLYPSTTAISRIDITLDSAQNFITDSTFYLYGIKNS